MRQVGWDEKTISKYYKSEGLCHLEYCSPVYSGGLTKQLERDLVRVIPTIGVIASPVGNFRFPTKFTGKFGSTIESFSTAPGVSGTPNWPRSTGRL